MEPALSDMAAKPGNARWSDFRLRSASALVLGAAALFCLCHGGWAWRFFIMLGLLGLGLEWVQLSKKRSAWVLPLIFCVLIGAANLAVQGHVALALGLLAGGAGLTGLVFGRFAAAGIPYAGLGGLALLSLRLQPETGLVNTLYLMLVVWGTDIGAYFAGRLCGGPKLAPAISPGKTWSGAIGGLLIGAGAGAGLAWWLHCGPERAFLVGGLLSLIAQAGDLLESAIKRRLGVKDSGRTIPGHGGLFDRLDGFLAAAPVAALLAYFAQGGVPLWR